MFQKLKEAYTKARYSRHYRISQEELDWLGARVEELGRVVHQVCSEDSLNSKGQPKISGSFAPQVRSFPIFRRDLKADIGCESARRAEQGRAKAQDAAGG